MNMIDADKRLPQRPREGLCSSHTDQQRPDETWSVRYRDCMGRGDAPTIAQTFSSRVAHVQLGLMALGVTLLATGTLAGSAHVTRCGAVLFLAGVILFLTQIHRVVAGRVA